MDSFDKQKFHILSAGVNKFALILVFILVRKGTHTKKVRTFSRKNKPLRRMEL